MFVVDISLSTLQSILEETATAGGNAVRFTVYDDSDEVPSSFTTAGLRLPSTELNAGEGSFFPADRA